MRIMADSNVLVSAMAFPKSLAAAAFRLILRSHSLILCSYVVDETMSVIRRKFPALAIAAEQFLSELSYEYFYTPSTLEPDLFQIRDPKDYPVLFSAVMSNAELLITGDKDFSDVQAEPLQILTPGEFVARYSNQEMM